MGSEQSSQNSNNQNTSRTGQLRRGKSVPNRETITDDTPPRSTSPGPSVCSDSDLPYISYTVNQPIGDSPKITNKQLLRGKTLSDIDTNKDPDLIKLQNIPMFLPIMRGTLNLPPGVRDPEILERLDPIGLYNLCARYQHHLNTNAQMIANEQNLLCINIYNDVNKLLLQAIEKQKKFNKFFDNLNKINELSKQLTKCHNQLNQTLESLEILNNLLPIDERLEPFVWTTG